MKGFLKKNFFILMFSFLSVFILVADIIFALKYVNGDYLAEGFWTKGALIAAVIVLSIFFVMNTAIIFYMLALKKVAKINSGDK